MPFEFPEGSVTLDFAKRAAGGAAPVETYERYYVGSLVGGNNYVPSDDGLFSSALGDENLYVELQDFGAGWENVVGATYGNDAVIGNSTDLRFRNIGATTLFILMRHHISSGTYEMYYSAEVLAGASYTPADEGLFSHASYNGRITCEYKYNAAWWYWLVNNASGYERGTCLAIGDGTNLRYHVPGGNAGDVVIMRTLMYS